MSPKSSPICAPGQAKPSRRPTLGYPFDPIPKTAVDLCHSGVLLRQDLDTLATLLRLARRVRTSCWTTRRHLAGTMGVSEATVKRSLRRLQQAGLIRHVQVETPDPDEPRNRTGWRFVFCWMEKGVNQLDNALSGASRGVGQLANTPIPSVTPTPGPARPLPRVIGDPQIERERKPLPPGSDGMNNNGVVVAETPDEETAAGAPGMPQEPPAPPPPVDRPSPAAGRSCGATAADVPAITARAMERFPEATEADVARAVADHGVERVAVAVMGLKRLESFRGVLGACRVWARGSAPADSEVKAARESLEARRPRRYYRHVEPTEAERAEARAAGAWLREFLRANR